MCWQLSTSRIFSVGCFLLIPISGTVLAIGAPSPNFQRLPRFVGHESGGREIIPCCATDASPICNVHGIGRLHCRCAGTRTDIMRGHLLLNTTPFANTSAIFCHVAAYRLVGYVVSRTRCLHMLRSSQRPGRHGFRERIDRIASSIWLAKPLDPKAASSPLPRRRSSLLILKRTSLTRSVHATIRSLASKLARQLKMASVIARVWLHRARSTLWKRLMLESIRWRQFHGCS